MHVHESDFILKVLTGSYCVNFVVLVAPGSDTDQQLALAGQPSPNAPHEGMFRFRADASKGVFARDLNH